MTRSNKMKNIIKFWILPFTFGALLNILFGINVSNWEFWVMGTIYVGTIFLYMSVLYI